MKKNIILKGTLILTAAGIISRLLGFFYRIFLIKYIGSEGLGLYQMVFPLLSVCLSVSCGGISLAIARFCARYISHKNYSMAGKTLFIGTGMSLLISFICILLLYPISDLIAIYIFNEGRCVYLIRIILFTLPFSVIHLSITSYYMGNQNTYIPALSQLVEQLARILCVYIICMVRTCENKPITAATGILGILAGEIASSLLCITVCRVPFSDIKARGNLTIIKNLLDMAVPISLNRVILSLLHSAEAIMIPYMLRLYGLGTSESLETYGILSGMAFPLVMLPQTLINAFASMLLPAVSGDDGSKSKASLNSTIKTAYHLCLSVGIFCLGVFIIWGNEACIILFNEPRAGYFVKAFAWMCPFLYLQTSLSSILNGLSRTKTTLFIDVVSHLLQIFIIILLIPRIGITGFLIAFLFGQCIMAILNSRALSKISRIYFDAFEWIVKPSLALVISTGISIYFHSCLDEIFHTNDLLKLLISGSIMSVSYLFFILLFSKKENKSCHSDVKH